MFFVKILALLRNFVTKMEALPIPKNTAIVPHYNLDEEQEKKEIVRHYRALLRALKEKLKKGLKIMELIIFFI